jgi:fermentation-respiration switch protein FrsA (DUF1100 family)
LLDRIARHSLIIIEQHWTWKFDPELALMSLLSFDSEEVLADIDCLVEMIYGEHSAVVSVEQAEKNYTALHSPRRLISADADLDFVCIGHIPLGHYR